MLCNKFITSLLMNTWTVYLEYLKYAANIQTNHLYS